MQARLLSVEDDIKPVIEYLTSLGLDTAQVKQVSAEHARLRMEASPGGAASAARRLYILRLHSNSRQCKGASHENSVGKDAWQRMMEHGS